MNLLPFLLIRAAQEQNRRSGSRSRSSSSKKSSSHYGSSSSSHSSSSSSYTPPKTLADYASRCSAIYMKDKLYSRIMTVANNNPELTRVYTNIHTHMASSINAYTEETLAKLTEQPAIDERFFKAREKAINCVTSVPVDLLRVNPYGFDEDYSYSLRRYNPTDSDPKRICYRTFQSATIYGIKITEEMLEMGANPFRDRYNEYAAKHPTYEEDYVRARKKVMRLEKHKFLLKIIPGRKDRLIEAQSDLDRAERIKRTAEVYLSEANSFDNLSNEERAYLIEYVQAEKAVLDSDDEYGKQIRILYELAGHETGYHALALMKEFYDTAVNSLSPEDRAIYDGAPREIMTTLANANEEEFAALEVEENAKDPKARLSPTRYIKDMIVESSIGLLETVSIDDLTGGSGTAE